MVRKELREHIFKMLFQIEFNDPQEMPEQIEYYFSTLEDAADKDKEYIKRKYAAVLEKTEEIDELINANAKGWKTTRMNKVDLSILRLAVYEMKFDEDIPLSRRRELVRVVLARADAWINPPRPQDNPFRSFFTILRCVFELFWLTWKTRRSQRNRATVAKTAQEDGTL